MEVKVISSEILKILEADVICVTEGSNHISENKHLRSRDIAEIVGIDSFVFVLKAHLSIRRKKNHVSQQAISPK